jgi:hypothetical protein
MVNLMKDFPGETAKAPAASDNDPLLIEAVPDDKTLTAIFRTLHTLKSRLRGRAK